MKLSICVPHYKEDWNTCKDLFDSIALQRGINFSDIEVIIANDGDEKVPVPDYPYQIRQIGHEHKGVSATRNLALDDAEGEYVMFCDIDDMFLNNCGLHLLFGAMNEQPDFINSSFIEEMWADDEYKIIRHDKDVTFVHGKAYRRQYLIDNNIRFDDSMTVHEDGYFNVIAHICTDKIKDISTPFYLWKWNDNSVVRKDREAFIFKTYDHLMKTRAGICRELEKRGFINEHFDAVVKTVVDSYYDFQKPEMLKPENKEICLKAKKAFKGFYDEFKDDYKESNVNRVAEMMYVCRQKAFSCGLRIEQQTIREFLNEITKL